MKTIEQRFLNKVLKTDQCWEWIGAKIPSGYGTFFVRENKKSEMAHRISFIIFNGNIPKGFHIDHLCRNHSCVNPQHLEAVTCQINILRGIGVAAINSKKTECNRGHSFKENSYTNGNGQRICKMCKRIARKIYLKKYPEKSKVAYSPEKRREKYIKWKNKHLIQPPR